MATGDQKNAVPSAPLLEGEYTYNEPGESTYPGQSTINTSASTMRPLPALPGQSRAQEADMVTDGLRALQLGDSRVPHIESFFLRQLGTFKGEYNGEAITEWVERVDLLKNILGAPDAEIIRVLPLRMSSRATEFLRSFMAARDSAEHTWANLR